jgi:hypothetical protein
MRLIWVLVLIVFAPVPLLQARRMSGAHRAMAAHRAIGLIVMGGMLLLDGAHTPAPMGMAGMAMVDVAVIPLAGAAILTALSVPASADAQGRRKPLALAECLAMTLACAATGILGVVGA